ncbi:MAG TPA: flagellar filament capping protein FliD [Acidobacteriota bacterium]|nr:flagellar filament capping protein FliD [Acidobacteriota bacterium]
MGSVNLIGGGLDVGTIVDQLMQIERQPETIMQNQITQNNNKVTAFQTLNTKLSSLLDKLNSFIYNGGDSNSLLMPSSFQDRLQQSLFSARNAVSSDDSTVSVSSTQGTAGGTYGITVSQLALAKTMASANFADATTTSAGTGTLVIQTGSADPVTVTIDSSNNTLTGIRNAINSANAGVTATIINDGSASPYRLIVASNETGTSNAFTLTNNLTGGTSLALTQTQAAVDANFTVNSISITKSSNTVSDVIDGVTLNLKALTSTPVSVTVTNDIDSIVSAFKDLASAYNDLNSFFNAQFTYNSTTKTAGLLSGDFTVRDVQSRVQQLLTQGITNGLSSYGVISQLGLTFGRDGALTVDETKLRNLLSTDMKGVAGLMLGSGDSADGEKSILISLQAALKGITDPLSGPIHSATDSLNKSTASIQDEISKFEERMTVVQEQLTEQYSQADQALKLLSLNQAALSNQLASLTKIGSS